MTLQSQLEGANHKPNFATTQLYHHSPLPDPTSCVRLIDLLPGNFNDEIQLLIFQVPLKEYDIRQGTVLSLDELKDTLPLGWVAKKTVEGRYLFKPKNTKRWQWAHPNPSFDEAQYVIPEFRNSQSALLQPWLEYEALSYTWGSKADTEIVFVEESESAATRPLNPGPISSLAKMALTANLTFALKHLRYKSKPRRLWVDAICINQLDNL
ncbi:MAG: hypothetical protein Q9157_005172 [Trypethelium eluteriae]